VKQRPVQLSLGGDRDRPVGPILPSVFQGTNADLMAAVAPLYLTGSVLDVTYGEGKWWDRFKPEPFTAHDLHKLDGVDFRALPEADRSVDTVCYDPPYVVSGGHSTARLGPAFQDRYGIGEHNTGQSVGHAARLGLRALIADGLCECCRVARSFVLVKCMEFAQGGQFHDIPTMVTNEAQAVGWSLHDRIVHHTGSGPGSHNILTVKRARRHHSYLLVFAKGA
jgi:hypothetical protein